MSAGNWFWIIFVVSVLINGVGYWPGDNGPWAGRARFGGMLSVFILFFILGYKVFGDLIKN